MLRDGSAPACPTKWGKPSRWAAWEVKEYRMSTFDTIQPIDDQTLDRLLNSIMYYEKNTNDDFLKYLEGQTLVIAAPWDQEKAREKLNSYKRELQEKEDKNKQNLAMLQKIVNVCFTLPLHLSHSVKLLIR
jgi:hypothetical protein